MSTSGEVATILCNMCNSTSTIGCLQCFGAPYCSTECQQKDWPTHRLLCRSLRNFHRGYKDQKWKRAILFPVDNRAPKFIWVEATMEHDLVTDTKWEKMQLGELLGSDNKAEPAQGMEVSPPEFELRGALSFQRNVLRNRDLDHTLVVAYRIFFMIDRSLPNLSILTATQGATPVPWKGPVVVFRQKGRDLNVVYEDMELIDFRHAVDFFLTCTSMWAESRL